ncbi:MAG: AmmeMemoRadiSam system protein B [Planctomycetota bacterium]|nr:AmmeMemoRadiSam system protein B [Planctomycetota bacterium]
MTPSALRDDLQFEQRGDEIQLTDPHQLSSVSATLPKPCFLLTQFFDGTRPLKEACRLFGQRFGQAFPEQVAEELCRQLSDNLFLADEQYQAAIDAYQVSASRSAMCAGLSYPSQIDEARHFLNQQRSRDGGPGLRRAVQREEPLLGIVAPHIDPHRGGSCYSWAYDELSRNSNARLFIILGTSHYGCGGRFSLTRKNYETPFGTLQSNQQLIDRILELYSGPEDLLGGDLAHKGEHSIEFQALHLAHSLHSLSDISILPVLCGSIHDLLLSGVNPRKDEAFTSFIHALKAALTGFPESEVLFIAGVDLSHVGEQYGGEKLNVIDHRRVVSADQKLLETLCLADLDAFHKHFERDLNIRQVCGHAPLTALLSLMEHRSVRGELLKQDSWYDGASTVGFASVAFRDIS